MASNFSLYDRIVCFLKIETILGFLNRYLRFYIGSKVGKRPKFKKSKKTDPLQEPIFYIPIDVFWCPDSKSHKINACFQVYKQVLGQKLNNAKNRFFNFQYKTPLFTYCSTRLELLILNLYRFLTTCKEIKGLRGFPQIIKLAPQSKG